VSVQVVRLPFEDGVPAQAFGDAAVPSHATIQ
jgi:hypothetical protein